jgi:membrane-bound serine protease (ClpP class)
MRRGLTTLLVLTLILLTPILNLYAVESSVSVSRALYVRIVPPWDVIDAGVAECIVDAVRYAESTRVAVLIELETYGGYLDAAFTIADTIATAKVPVVVYVSGGKAFSAGTLISLPAHYLYLSPIATIGAMQPVSIDPLTGRYVPINDSKVINPIIEKAEFYARLRNRNTTAVRLFITSNLVLTAYEAVRKGIADGVVENLQSLLGTLRGKNVTIGGVVYRFSDIGLEGYSCSIRSRFISLLSNTLLSSVLMTIGIMATIFTIASGRFEALPLALVFLALGLVGSGFSPNLISIFLVLVGAALLSVELFLTPGFGALGIAGIVMLATGFALLPTGGPTYIAPGATLLEVSRYVAIGLGATLGLLTGFIVYKVIQAKRRRVELFELVGKVGRAVDSIPVGATGFVVVEGEYWRATSLDDVDAGSLVVVVERRDGVLVVRRYVGSS